MQPIIWNTLLQMHISLPIWDVWGCLPFALPTTHILSAFLLWPIAKLKSQLSCPSNGAPAPSPPSLEQWFVFSKAHSEMALFSGSHSVAPWARACQDVRLPEPEPRLVYTNSSEKYGCIIIEVVSFNVASSPWKPPHAWSATMRGGWWNSDRVWREHFCGKRFGGAKERKKGGKKGGFSMEPNQFRAKQANMNHKAVIGIAVVVQRINTQSKYYSAGQDQARFCEFSSVAKCPCSIPTWPQAHKHGNRSRQTHRRRVCAQTRRHK